MLIGIVFIAIGLFLLFKPKKKSDVMQFHEAQNRLIIDYTERHEGQFREYRHS